MAMNDHSIKEVDNKVIQRYVTKLSKNFLSRKQELGRRRFEKYRGELLMKVKTTTKNKAGQGQTEESYR
jgi:hypothetical protein